MLKDIVNYKGINVKKELYPIIKYIEDVDKYLDLTVSEELIHVLTNYFTSLEDIKKIYQGHSFEYYIFIIVTCCIFICSVSILAKPVFHNVEEKQKQEGIDIALVFDVSYSMEAKDLEPNRISVAKEMVSKFLDSLQGHRVSLVLFSGKPFFSSPLTFDYSFLKEFILSLTTDVINQRIMTLQ